MLGLDSSEIYGETVTGREDSLTDKVVSNRSVPNYILGNRHNEDLSSFGLRLSERLLEVVQQSIQELADRSAKQSKCVEGIRNRKSNDDIEGPKVPVVPSLTAISGDTDPGSDVPDDEVQKIGMSQITPTQWTSEPKSARRLSPSPSMMFCNLSSTTSRRSIKTINGRRSSRKNSDAQVLNVNGGAFNILLTASDRAGGDITGDSIRDTEAIDLHKKFVDLDDEKTGLVSIETLLRYQSVFEDSYSEKVIDECRDAVREVNMVIGDQHKGPLDKISLETFKVLMLATQENLEARIGETSTNLIIQNLRRACVLDNVADNIGVACGVSRQDMDGNQAANAFIDTRLEPMVAFVILLNAVTIGLSLDLEPDWNGWKIVDLFFTCFFIFELVCKLHHNGVLEHFLGFDWLWNWFDLFIVVCAITDSVIAILSFSGDDHVDLSGLVIVRMIRLSRIARLVRLLHLKAFRELSLMVHGVIGGMKTLFWAVVLLTVVIYVLGVMVRQMLDPTSYKYDCQDARVLGKPTPTCQAGDLEFSIYGPVMFGSVSRSMLTVFLCLMDGCDSPGGFSILWQLWETQGPFVILCCVLVFIFVTFGIFNLILAIFVENTMNAAFLHDQRRTARKQAQIRQAQNLQKLLVRVCTVEDESEVVKRQTSKGLRKHLAKLSIRSGGSNERPQDHHLEARVSRFAFEQALEADEVQNLLDDLDVSITSRSQLFDILDSDGNGYLAIKELVDGIMRLRGGEVDKGDVVSTLLMMRCLQNHVRRFEEAVLHNQRGLEKMIQKLYEGGAPDSIHFSSISSCTSAINTAFQRNQYSV